MQLSVICEYSALQILLLLIYHVHWTTQIPANSNIARFKRAPEARAAADQDDYRVPFIVLMSNETVAVVQLPLIEDGNVTAVYHLDDDAQVLEDANFDSDERDDYSLFEDQSEYSNTYEANLKGRGDSKRGGSGTDGYGYEQQQASGRQMLGLETTLGKSERQQIAIGANGRSEREEVPPKQMVTSTISRKEDGHTDEGAAYPNQQPRGRRRVRSNNLISSNERGHRDSNDGVDEELANKNNVNESSTTTTGVQHKNDEPKDGTNNAVQRADEATGEGAKESALNVTSARFEEQQTNSNGFGEEISRAQAGKAGAGLSSPERSNHGASSLPPTSPRMDARTVTEAARNDFLRLQFSDFDVHMMLGFAFVSDTAGRIHRFKIHTSAPPSSREYVTTGVDPSANMSTSHQTNTINVDQNWPDHLSRLKNSSSTLADAAHYDNSVLQNHADNLPQLQSNEPEGEHERAEFSVTHEQLSKIRQHPTTSGEQTRRLSVDGAALAPVSGLRSLNNQPADYGTEGNRHQNTFSGTDETEPKIIWSRNKHRLQAAAARLKSAKLQQPTTAQQSVADGRVDGAQASGAYPATRRPPAAAAGAAAASSPVVSVGTFTGASATADANERTQGGNNQRVRLKTGNSEATSDDDEETSHLAADQKAASKETKLKQAAISSRTQIAVDWLNNLLFILDKYRLLIVDFNGNNELVLIDDFSANNRPVNIKVDPVNNFLFWLQVGKFHNTIYKLDLSVLSMPTATQKLVSNSQRLRLSTNRSLGGNSDAPEEAVNQKSGTNHKNKSDFTYDSSELVALVSHHYAHPVITNLPRHAKLFTIDHKHSRIYVPLSSKSELTTDYDGAGASKGGQNQDDIEIFASSDTSTTHLNSSELNDCAPADNSSSIGNNAGQILAYNLDGTDVGPLRVVGKNSHITHLDSIQDMTLDSDRGLLYWLTNDGRELFEEYRDGATIHPAQHNLEARYSKLKHFSGLNQPRGQRSRFNMRQLIHVLVSSISPNRWVRSENHDTPENGFAYSLNSRISSRYNSELEMAKHSQNAPYILGAVCLVVIVVYLVYTFLFQQTNFARSGSRRSDTGSGGSSVSPVSFIQDCVDSNGVQHSSTFSRWAGRGSSIGTTASSNHRESHGDQTQLGSYDIESTNYHQNTINAIDEHYRDGRVEQTDNFFDIDTTRLANLSQWPCNMADLSNKLYVPVEVLKDDALSSIRRIPIDQLEIERTAPLGKGNFGVVLQGTIKCDIDEKFTSLNRSQMIACCENPASPDSLATLSPNILRQIATSSTSSGHGSSSSNSCEFNTANSCTDGTKTNSGDYLTPKSQCYSSSSDYEPERGASSSCGTYCNTASYSTNTVLNSSGERRIKVAIKKLKDNASNDEKRDFLQEAKLLADFDHPNIVHLIGICLDRGSTLIVMELMLGGDLIRYMRENTPSNLAVTSRDGELTYDDLLKICLDIVNGCCYLEDLDYIHRDLAARNCLVSSRKQEERVVKLGDFGLARDIYKNSYYKKINDGPVPFKWMAPECLIEQKFTKKSDVWSFGVVMWEVMSYCQESPYEGIESMLMKEVLARGVRLEKPSTCDEDMYKLMNRCWLFNPEDRPTFHECRAILIEIRHKRLKRVN